MWRYMMTGRWGSVAVPVKSAKQLNAVDVHVGSRVRSLRIQLKMSQTDLGESLGITFQQVQKYEKGKNRISSSRLHQIAKVLGVTPPYFFQDPLAEVAHHGSAAMKDFDEFCASREGVALMQAFVRIKDKAMRHTIAKLIEDLAH